MKISNLNELNDKIQSEISWRKFEISQLKISCKEAVDKKKEALLRASHVMVYAHFEGCIKELSEYYLNFISNQSIKINDMSIPIAATALKSKIFSFNDTKKASLYIKIYNEIKNSNESHTISSKNSINTESNLTSDNFKEICACIDMDHNLYLSKLPNIDAKLCKIRHDIAHGKRINIIEKDFYEITDTVIDIINLYSDEVIKIAKNNKYRR